jgi:hypothetical protein
MDLGIDERPSGAAAQTPWWAIEASVAVMGPHGRDDRRRRVLRGPVGYVAILVWTA